MVTVVNFEWLEIRSLVVTIFWHAFYVAFFAGHTLLCSGVKFRASQL